MVNHLFLAQNEADSNTFTWEKYQQENSRQSPLGIGKLMIFMASKKQQKRYILTLLNLAR
jgi:hypothetical protein